MTIFKIYFVKVDYNYLGRKLILNEEARKASWDLDEDRRIVSSENRRKSSQTLMMTFAHFSAWYLWYLFYGPDGQNQGVSDRHCHFFLSK